MSRPGALGLYVRYAAISVRGQMQYRASFAALAAAHFISTGSEFLGLWALFARFGSLQGWTLAEVALLYGIMNTAFALAEGAGRGFDVFAATVRSGDFDRVLLRPRSTALQVMGQEFQLLRVGRFLQGVAVMAWAWGALDARWSPGAAALMLAAVGCAFCIFLGLLVVQATAAFWTVEPLEIMNAVTYGGVESGSYPLPVYRRWFRLFFTFVVPLAAAGYLPASVISGRALPYGLTPLAVAALTLAGPLFLCASLALWRVGVRHYASTGT